MIKIVTSFVFLFLLGLVPSASSASDCALKVSLLLSSTNASSAEWQNVLPVCREESSKGNSDAKYYLSFFYTMGLAGVEHDLKKATELTRDAANEGLPMAQYWMGWQSEIGDLLPKSEQQALMWYQKAAESGYSLAASRLARAFDKGELGLSADAQKARQWRETSERCSQASIPVNPNQRFEADAPSRRAAQACR